MTLKVISVARRGNIVAYTLDTNGKVKTFILVFKTVEQAKAHQEEVKKKQRT